MLPGSDLRLPLTLATGTTVRRRSVEYPPDPPNRAPPRGARRRQREWHIATHGSQSRDRDVLRPRDVPKRKLGQIQRTQNCFVYVCSRFLSYRKENPHALRECLRGNLKKEYYSLHGKTGSLVVMDATKLPQRADSLRFCQCLFQEI